MTPTARAAKPRLRIIRFAPHLALLMAMLAVALMPIGAQPAAGQSDPNDHRWLQIDTSVLRTDPESQRNPQARLDAPRFYESYLDLIANADDYGYTGVLLRGGELNALLAIDGTDRFTGRDAGFVSHVAGLSKAARDRGMDVVVTLGSIGRCNPVLAPNNAFDLATAYPVTMAVQANPDGTIAPADAITREGSLTGRTIVGAGTETVRVTSLERGGQYRVVVDLASTQGGEGRLGAGTIALRVDDATTGQSLNRLILNEPTTDSMTQIAMAFNSFVSTAVRVSVVAGEDRGTLPLRITDYKVESVPLLNGVNRNGSIGVRPALALDVFRDGRVVRTLSLRNGLRLDSGDLRGVPRDPLLGEWDSVVGSWSAAHDAPTLHVTAPVDDADWLRLRGWHALPNLKTVACSWNDPALSQLIGRIARYVVDDYQATGIVLPFDEINSGGAEPADGSGTNATGALANSLANNVGAVRRAVGGGTPIYVFNDMIDRNVNARECYVHVVGRLDQEARIRVPNNVTVLTWDESGTGNQHFVRNDDNCGVTRGDRKPGFDIATHRQESLDNMAGLAGSQLVAAYYDIDDIGSDHRNWQQAIAGSDATNVDGVVYATWENPGRCPAYPDQTGAPLACEPPCTAAQEAFPGRCTRQCKDDLELRGCAFEHLQEFAELWWGEVPDDRICDGRVPTLFGGAGDDVIRGTAGDDVIWAGNGNDVVFGFGGDDLICGGQGDDRIFGQAGRDRIFAGPGSNEVFGGSENDTLFGGREQDRLWGGPGADVIYGSSGVDYVAGGPGNDELFGGPDNDELLGGDDNDRLNGGPDSDVCHGGRGTDIHVGNCEVLRSTP